MDSNKHLSIIKDCGLLPFKKEHCVICPRNMGEGCTKHHEVFLAFYRLLASCGI